MPSKPLPGRWKWNSTEGYGFGRVCPNDPSDVLEYVNRYDWATGDLSYWLCKKCRERVRNSAKYAKRTPEQKRRAALMSGRWRLRKRIRELQAELDAVKAELEESRPGPAAG